MIKILACFEVTKFELEKWEIEKVENINIKVYLYVEILSYNLKRNYTNLAEYTYECVRAYGFSNHEKKERER